MTCRLTIITPVFNGARYMEFCIRNVIEQHCPDAEHIIVDGGSTDGTVEIIRHYADEYPHIRWVSEKDRGQSDAMNKGISMATGEILSFLNVDDYYEPGTLNAVLALFRTLPEPSLLVGNCNVWDDDGTLSGVGRPSGIGLLNLLCGRFTTAFPLNPSSYFYHKSLHAGIGPYDVDDHFGMDVDFIFRAVQAAHVKYVDRVWGNMRYFADTKTYVDVASGQNRIRVAGIIDRYRQQAPLHYRVYSSIYVRLVRIYKFCRKAMGGH